MDELLWCEKYRPHKIADTVLPQRLKKVFEEYVAKGSIPNLMFTGSAGVGKTTVARALCEEIGLDYIFINSSNERGIDTLRNKITNYASTMSLTGGRKVIILDEADYITPDAQAALRGAMEEFSSNCTFILTCNFKAKLIDAIHSRCSIIDFTLTKDERAKMASAFHSRLTHILKQENIQYDGPVLIELVKKFFPDYRRTLNEIQRYAQFGKLDGSVFDQISDVRNLQTLMANLKDKDFGSMRKWVVLNSDIDPSTLYRTLYDNLASYLKPHSIPQAIVLLAKYQYQAAFVADQEINLVACLTEIMVDVEFQ